jgi:hypothetical protein
MMKVYRKIGDGLPVIVMHPKAEVAGSIPGLNLDPVAAVTLLR